MTTKFLTILILYCTTGFADSLPVAGLEIDSQTGWREYTELKAFADQPFERVWLNPANKSIRMISTTFSNSKKVCMSEKWSLEKKNFVTNDFKTESTAKLSCGFTASLGSEKFFVAVRNVIRKLPSGKNFVSQSVFVEKNGDMKDFKRWIASAKPIKVRTKK